MSAPDMNWRVSAGTLISYRRLTNMSYHNQVHGYWRSSFRFSKPDSPHRLSPPPNRGQQERRQGTSRKYVRGPREDVLKGCGTVSRRHDRVTKRCTYLSLSHIARFEKDGPSCDISNAALNNGRQGTDMSWTKLCRWNFLF